MASTVPASFDARTAAERLLDLAARRNASDLHLEPVAHGYEARLRVDGLLTCAQTLDTNDGRAIVNRLMVMAQLLTYRLDVPQEGRFAAALPSLGRAIELRLAIMPTTHGLRAAVRLPAELNQPRSLDSLNLPPLALAGMQRFIHAASGMLILTGPAGSGKTTAIYALLDAIVQSSQGGLSVISLEDPVERDLLGVTQIEVKPFGELTYDKALRSILRQDPQVLSLGEIRDPATASMATQAAMGGHRLVSTLHAATCGGAIVRLMEMGVEPYQLTSSLFGVVAVRLLRRKTDEGYAGRLPIASCAVLDDRLREAVLARCSAQRLDALLAESPDYETLEAAANNLVREGLTDDAEVRRVLGSQAAPLQRGG